MRWASVKWGLPFLLIALLAFAVRALGFEWVFVEGGDVVFPPGDAQYHARRAFYSFMYFPDVLLWDSYINYPSGAAISWPPLFDLVVGGALRVLGLPRDIDGMSFFAAAAWAPPVFGVLALAPVWLIARELGSRGLALGAAALLALFPISVTYSRVGQLDHHCAVALIGAFLLLFTLQCVGRSEIPRASVLGLALARVAMLLTWHGSLLYLGLVEATLWVAAALLARRDLYRAQAISALVTVCLIAPLVWFFPTPLGGDYSAIALSRLHVLAVAATALVSAAMWWVERPSGGERSAMARLVLTVGLGFGILLLALALPGPREGLEPALRFVSMRDGVGLRTGEQLPLFPLFGRVSGRPAIEVWGGFAYGIAILPFALAGLAQRRRSPALFALAAWCAFFGAFAIVQRRYGNDLGPAAAVGFALLLAATGRGLAARLPRAPVAVFAAVLAALLLAPPVFGQYRVRALHGLRVLRGDVPAAGQTLSTLAGTLTAFLEQVRAATPSTAGYFDASVNPEYGVVAHANLGHAIQNVARRPTPTDPFWAFIGQENWDRAFGMLAARSEARGLELAAELRARYVITMSSADPSTLEGWLHHRDGLAAKGFATTGRFRLVTEGPRGGVPFAASFQLDPSAKRSRLILPYKLFEVVRGAVLEVPADPGSEVVATLALETPSGRELVYRVAAKAGDDGVARLRVAYATEQSRSGSAVFGPKPYRVEVGPQRFAARVPEAAIASGAAVAVATR